MEKTEQVQQLEVARKKIRELEIALARTEAKLETVGESRAAKKP